MYVAMDASRREAPEVYAVDYTGVGSDLVRVGVARGWSDVGSATS